MSAPGIQELSWELFHRLPCLHRSIYTFSMSVLLCFPPRNRWLPYKTLHITSFGGGFSAGHPQLVRLSRVMSMPRKWGHPVWHLHSAISVSLISGITENCLPLLLCPLTSCMTARSNVFPDYAKRKHITGLKKKKNILHIMKDWATVSVSFLRAGSMKGQRMKVWLEPSCSSRSRRRRCSVSRPTWPAGCPGPTSTPLMTHWPRGTLQC